MTKLNCTALILFLFFVSCGSGMESPTNAGSKKSTKTDKNEKLDGLIKDINDQPEKFFGGILGKNIIAVVAEDGTIGKTKFNSKSIGFKLAVNLLPARNDSFALAYVENMGKADSFDVIFGNKDLDGNFVGDFVDKNVRDSGSHLFCIRSLELPDDQSVHYRFLYRIDDDDDNRPNSNSTSLQELIDRINANRDSLFAGVKGQNIVGVIADDESVAKTRYDVKAYGFNLTVGLKPRYNGMIATAIIDRTGTDSNTPYRITVKSKGNTADEVPSFPEKEDIVDTKGNRFNVNSLDVQVGINTHKYRFLFKK
jgi:hypothetical protein